MRILFEDLQFWSVTSGKIYFQQAYEKAKKIHEEGFEPICDWTEVDYVDVKKGSPLKDKSFKKFKQSKRTIKKKKTAKKV